MPEIQRYTPNLVEYTQKAQDDINLGLARTSFIQQHILGHFGRAIKYTTESASDYSPPLYPGLSGHTKAKVESLSKKFGKNMIKKVYASYGVNKRHPLQDMVNSWALPEIPFSDLPPVNSPNTVLQRIKDMLECYPIRKCVIAFRTSKDGSTLAPVFRERKIETFYDIKRLLGIDEENGTVFHSPKTKIWSEFPLVGNTIGQRITEEQESFISTFFQLPPGTTVLLLSRALIVIELNEKLGLISTTPIAI